MLLRSTELVETPGLDDDDASLPKDQVKLLFGHLTTRYLNILTNKLTGEEKFEEVSMIKL